MNVSLSRIILYVRDVELLASFYRDRFGLPVVEAIPGEWAVLKAGPAEIALHRVGEAFRTMPVDITGGTSNTKLVLTVDRDLVELRAELIAHGVSMREIKSFPGLTGPLCDGVDPEGNVFQLSQAATARRGG